MTDWIEHVGHKCPVDIGTEIDVLYNDGTEETLVVNSGINNHWRSTETRTWKVSKWRVHAETSTWKNVVDLTTKPEYHCPHCEEKDKTIATLRSYLDRLRGMCGG